MLAFIDGGAVVGCCGCGSCSSLHGCVYGHWVVCSFADGCYLCAILQLLLQGLGASGVGQFGVMAVPIHGPPFLQSDLAVSPEVPSAGRVGLMAGVRGFASNGVVYLGAG